MTFNSTTAEYIAAIHIGTSKIIGVIAQKNASGILQILTSVEEKTNGCVKRGIVKHADQASLIVSRILNGLENKIGKKLSKVYVNLGGSSIRLVEWVSERRLDAGESITQNDLDSMDEEIQEWEHPDYEMLELESPYYLTDHKLARNPLGASCSLFEGVFRAVIARHQLRSNLLSCFDGVEVGTVIAPIAAAKLMLTHEEKVKGAAYVDFGASTTTLCVYKSGALEILCVIPFGGQTITRDIVSQFVREDQAERLKFELGALRLGEEYLDRMIETTAGKQISELEINAIIVARQKEIWQTVWKQIQSMNLQQELSTIVIAGGASKIKGLKEIIQETTSIEVRPAIIPSGIPAEMRDPAYLGVLALLSGSKSDCVAVEVVDESAAEALESEAELKARLEEERIEEEKRLETERLQKEEAERKAKEEEERRRVEEMEREEELRAEEERIERERERERRNIRESLFSKIRKIVRPFDYNESNDSM